MDGQARITWLEDASSGLCRSSPDQSPELELGPYFGTAHEAKDYHTPRGLAVLDPILREFSDIGAMFSIDGVKVGGIPFWLQKPVLLRCHCGHEMEFFAQIPSFVIKGFPDDWTIRWGDSGSMYLLQCPDHLDCLRFVNQTF